MVEAHRDPRHDRRLLGPHLCDRLDLQQRTTHPSQGCGRVGARGLFRRRYPQGPGGLPEVRPHGARDPLGPRRLPGPRLQRGVPAQAERNHPGHHRDGEVRQALQSTHDGRAERSLLRDAADAQGEPVRRSLGDAAAHIGRGGRLPHPDARMERILHQEGRRARPAGELHQEPGRTAGPERVLRVGVVGDGHQPPRQGLLLHQQLAVRPDGGQQAVGRGVRLERDEPHHAARRPRPHPFHLRQVRLPRMEGRGGSDPRP